jgi:ferritin-like metal-binding protein YciE
MSLDSLQSLFVEELKDIYHGEKQLLEALPWMAKAAASPELPKAAKELGLVLEGKELMQEGGEAPVVDAALTGAAQRMLGHENAAKLLA